MKNEKDKLRMYASRLKQMRREQLEGSLLLGIDIPEKATTKEGAFGFLKQLGLYQELCEQADKPIPMKGYRPKVGSAMAPGFRTLVTQALESFAISKDQPSEPSASEESIEQLGEAVSVDQAEGSSEEPKSSSMDPASQPPLDEGLLPADTQIIEDDEDEDDDLSRFLDEVIDGPVEGEETTEAHEGQGSSEAAEAEEEMLETIRIIGEDVEESETSEETDGSGENLLEDEWLVDPDTPLPDTSVEDLDETVEDEIILDPTPATRTLHRRQRWWESQTVKTVLYTVLVVLAVIGFCFTVYHYGFKKGAKDLSSLQSVSQSLEKERDELRQKSQTLSHDLLVEKRRADVEKRRADAAELDAKVKAETAVDAQRQQLWDEQQKARDEYHKAQEALRVAEAERERFVSLRKEFPKTLHGMTNDRATQIAQENGSAASLVKSSTPAELLAVRLERQNREQTEKLKKQKEEIERLKANSQSAAGKNKKSSTTNTPTPLPLKAKAAKGDRTVKALKAETFDASPSMGSISRYEWDFGDGPPFGSGKKESHSYLALGTFTAVLTVYDDQGKSDRYEFKVTVTP